MTSTKASPAAEDVERIAIVEERAEIFKRAVDLEKVTIHVGSETRQIDVEDILRSERFEVTRVPVGTPIDTPPPIRKEADRLVIPIIEERLVVEKRLILVEELHVLREHYDEVVSVPVELRHTTVSIDRSEGGENTE